MEAVASAIQQEQLSRQAMWTEAIAVGTESFARKIKEQTKKRKRLYLTRENEGAWCVRELDSSYARRNHKG